MSSNFLAIARQLHTLANQLANTLCSPPNDPFAGARAEIVWRRFRQAVIAAGSSLNAHSCPIADWVRRLGRAARQFDELVRQRGMDAIVAQYDVAIFDGLIAEGERLLRECPPKPADPFAFVDPPPTSTAPPTSTSTPTAPPPTPTPATTTSTPAPTATADPNPAPPTPSTPPTRKRRAALNSAAINHAVADWLRQHATDPFAVTIRAVALAVGASVGGVANTPSWQVFNAQRRKLRPGGRREVPLTDELLAILPARDRTDELERLIQQQETDRRRDERRSRRSDHCS